jgi:carboxypeptidase PM20D1
VTQGLKELTVMRTILVPLGALFAVLVGFSAVLTARYDSPQAPVTPAPSVAISEGAAERLAGAIRIPTISTDDSAAFAAESFRAMHAYLQEAFPGVHVQLRRETVGTHSLL